MVGGSFPRRKVEIPRKRVMLMDHETIQLLLILLILIEIKK